MREEAAHAGLGLQSRCERASVIMVAAVVVVGVVVVVVGRWSTLNCAYAAGLPQWNAARDVRAALEDKGLHVIGYMRPRGCASKARSWWWISETASKCGYVGSACP
jgi:hypothetical protein